MSIWIGVLALPKLASYNNLERQQSRKYYTKVKTLPEDFKIPIGASSCAGITKGHFWNTQQNLNKKTKLFFNKSDFEFLGMVVKSKAR